MSLNALAMLGVFAMMLMGAFLRKRRALHATLMTLGVLMTFAGVAHTEITRGLGQAVLAGTQEIPGNEYLFHWVHLPASLLTLTSMLIMLCLGLCMLRKGAKTTLRKWHKRIGITCLTFFALTLASAPGLLIDQLLALSG